MPANYFIVKSLRLTRPGGLVVLLTSRYTLDARNPAARREIDGLADLVGACRFPKGAFWESSNTEVVCDLLILHRRAEDRPRNSPAWVATVPAPTEEQDGEPLFLNEYLVAHPDHILGALTVDRGMYRSQELTVEPSGPLCTALDDALARISVDATRRGLRFQPLAQTDPAAPLTPQASADDDELRFAQEGSFVLVGGRVARIEQGQPRPHRSR